MTEYVYIMRGGGYIKVGQSKDVYVRLNGFNAGTVPFPMALVCFAFCMDDVGNVELWLQSRMTERTQGEWFKDTGQSDEGLRSLMRGACLHLKMGRAMKVYDTAPLAEARALHEKMHAVPGDPAREAAEIMARLGPSAPVDAPKSEPDTAPHKWQESGKSVKTSRRKRAKPRKELTPLKIKYANKIKMLERLERMKQK